MSRYVAFVRSDAGVMLGLTAAEYEKARRALETVAEMMRALPAKPGGVKP